MDKVNFLKNVAKNEFTTRAKRLSLNRPGVKREFIFDEKKQRYLLVATGWHENNFVHEIYAHVKIQAGKVWILEDRLDPGLIEAFEEQGVSPKDIIPAYLPDYQPVSKMVAA